MDRTVVMASRITWGSFISGSPVWLKQVRKGRGSCLELLHLSPDIAQSHITAGRGRFRKASTEGVDQEDVDRFGRLDLARALLAMFLFARPQP